MKRRNREVSIFSMSALDLFASALGAFILIAIVMFPYFPNTGMASEAEMDEALEKLRVAAEGNDELTQIADELEQAIDGLRTELEACRNELAACRAENTSQQARIDDLEGQVASQQTQIDAQQNRINDLEFPHLDLVIALDVTGSMRDVIEGLKAEIDGLSSVLQRLAPSVGVGVVAFGDREWPRPLTQFPLVDIGAGGNRTSLTGFVDSLSVNMGQEPDNPDPPEAVLAAVRAAADMPWRSQAERRQVIVITDNPAYPEEVEATVAAAAAFAAGGRGGSVSTVFVDTDGDEGTEAFLRRVASEGGGQAVRAGGSMTANLLLSLL